MDRHSVVRLTFAGDRIEQIADYLHCPWVLQNAGNVVTGATPSEQNEQDHERTAPQVDRRERLVMMPAPIDAANTDVMGAVPLWRNTSSRYV